MRIVPFEEIGAEFEETGQTRAGTVRSASTRLFAQRAAVDFAVERLAVLRRDEPGQ